MVSADDTYCIWGRFACLSFRASVGAGESWEGSLGILAKLHCIRVQDRKTLFEYPKRTVQSGQGLVMGLN